MYSTFLLLNLAENVHWFDFLIYFILFLIETVAENNNSINIPLQ